MHYSWGALEAEKSEKQGWDLMGPAARLGDYALTSRGLMEAKEAYSTAVEVHVVPVLTMNSMVLEDTMWGQFTPC